MSDLRKLMDDRAAALPPCDGCRENHWELCSIGGSSHFYIQVECSKCGQSYASARGPAEDVTNLIDAACEAIERLVKR